MASSLFTLLDDIATLLDDVAAMTKVATKKTAGVLGDDLALNAEQVTGINPDRELPVIWAVAKGAALNKAIIVPAALLISAVAPWLVTPLLMLGGSFLAYEGFHKVSHKLFHSKEEEQEKRKKRVDAVKDPKVDMVQFEKDKIKGAIRTDFILSAEIIVIALGTVAAEPFMTRLGVLVSIAALVVVFVYGLVSGIVKIDDAGLALMEKDSAAAQAVGKALVTAAPWLMKGLSFFGTIAMFLVGGGILSHGIPPVEAIVHDISHAAPATGAVKMALEGVVGLIAGAIIAGVIALIQKARGKKPAH